ncbi:MAG: ATP-binding protein [Clostridiales bacterium]|jgi:predicted AAA+ superfamily ATPase|nr:ATP-binding protein [Clostridiales bacterium]
MIQRKEYLERLIAWKHEKVIKVVSGIRRCGKSSLLKLYQRHLRDTGVSDGQMLVLNFEELENDKLLNYKELYNYLVQRLYKGGYTYIFLDEIQKVENFEKAVDSLYIKDNVDIYITGSNAYLLSGELATLLSGRYIQIKMLPFSFAEYYGINKSRDKDKAFADYMSGGAFPYIALMGHTKEKADEYLEAIYNTVILKDIEERSARRESDPNKRKASDITLLKNVARFLASNIGSPMSVKRIADFITSSGRRVSQNTVDGYIEALEQAFIFYPAERYDIEGKQLLKRNQKIYIVDLGLRKYLLAKKEYDLGYSLENVVFLELLRRGFSVNVGKVGATEVDFVAAKDGAPQYFQVTASLTDENTFNREFAPLKSIKDNYPKTILTLDRFTPGNYEGIQVLNAVDWLLGT